MALYGGLTLLPPAVPAAGGPPCGPFRLFVGSARPEGGARVPAAGDIA